MAYFSNGTEGDRYQAEYCRHCMFWVGDDLKIGSDVGCPIWQVHELYVGDADWQPTLDMLIPMVPKVINGIAHSFPGECVGFFRREQ